MDDQSRLVLQRMIAENNVLDQTPLIRQLKHSVQLRQDISALVNLKALHMDDPETLNLEAMNECNFLFTYYTDLYHKIRKDEVELEVLYQLLDVLGEIEDGKTDQHEGSYKVGMLLKKIYLDSAIKRSQKLDEAAAGTAEEYRGADVKVSYKDFKKLREDPGVD